MALPTLAVDCAFDTDPLAITPTYTDISAYADDLTITIGKQSELDAYQPGQITIGRLKNDDRRFDPTHTTGPYTAAGVTKVLPRKKIRARATWAGITYDLITAFADGWPQRPAGLKVSDIAITATDLFALLANVEMPVHAHERLTIDDGAIASYRVTSDGEFLDLIGKRHGTLGEDVTVGSITLAGITTPVALVKSPKSDTPLVNDTRVSGKITIPHFDLAPSALPFTVEFVAQLGDFSETSNPSLWLAIGRTGAYNADNIGFNWYRAIIGPNYEEGVVAMTTIGGAARLETTSAVVPPADESVRHFTYVRTATVHKLYQDGVELAVTAFGFAGITADTGGEIRNLDLQFEDEESTFRIGRLAIYHSELTATQIADHAAAALAPWDGDTTGARAARIAVLAGLDATQYDIDTGKSTLGPATLGGKALDQLRQIEATEHGHLYVDHANAGKLRFDDRHVRLTASRSTTVQATFTDEDTPGTIHVERNSIELLWDEQLIYNEVTVAWAGGASITVSDAASITAYGRRTYSVTTQSRTAAEARALGEWILSHYKAPIVRIRSLELNPAADDTSAVAALSLQLGDLVQVKVKPQDVGARITFNLLVEGKQHRFNKAAGTWTTSLYLSPADTQSYAIWGTGLWDTALWGY